MVWTSSAEDASITTTVCILNGQCANTGESNYFIASDSSGNIYVSYYGSAGAEEVNGLAGGSYSQINAQVKISVPKQGSHVSFTVSATGIQSFTHIAYWVNGHYIAKSFPVIPGCVVGKSYSISVSFNGQTVTKVAHCPTSGTITVKFLLT